MEIAFNRLSPVIAHLYMASMITEWAEAAIKYNSLYATLYLTDIHVQILTIEIEKL